MAFKKFVRDINNITDESLVFKIDMEDEPQPNDWVMVWNGNVGAFEPARIMAKYFITDVLRDENGTQLNDEGANPDFLHTKVISIYYIIS